MNLEENILQFIPQRHPFVMIDNLLFADEKITRTNFTVSAENIFYENDAFTEAGLLENIAQTAAAAAGYKAIMQNKPVSVGYIAAVKNFEIFFLPKINNELITEIVTTDHVLNVTVISGKVLCNGQLAAQCEMKIFINSRD